MKTIALGRVDYLPTYRSMQAFTAARNAQTADELWVCEHPRVFTQGLAGKPEHVHATGDIPVVQANRGGQVTYHGPGQVVAYPLLDLQRAGYYVKEYVYRIEEAVIRTLAHYGVTGHRVAGAPGIYVRLDDPFSHARWVPSEKLPPPLGEGRGGGSPSFNGLGKIAALGIKVSRHCTYHGVAVNVAMNLEPFTRIDPCGYAGLKTVDLSTIGVSTPPEEAAGLLAKELATLLAP